jgi:nucleoside-diphosphate-sugar epimerase
MDLFLTLHISQAKVDSFLETHTGASHRLDFAIVPDITAQNAFSEAYQSEDPFDTVIHTASPFLYREAKNNRDLLDPAIKGTKEILNGARKTPSIKRVIVLSSIAAIMNYIDASPPGGRVWTDKDWNPITWTEAIEAEDYSTAYRASKTFSERAGMFSLLMFGSTALTFTRRGIS